jgi:excinuclease UvrABC nuclease subunit
MTIKIDLPKIEKVLTIDEIINIPQLGGVYFLCSNDNVLYIGRTVNLKQRIYEHIKGRTNTEPFHKTINYISYFITEDIIDQEIYESHAIRIFNPPFNKSKTNKKDVSKMFNEYNYKYTIQEQKQNKTLTQRAIELLRDKHKDKITVSRRELQRMLGIQVNITKEVANELVQKEILSLKNTGKNDMTVYTINRIKLLNIKL